MFVNNEFIAFVDYVISKKKKKKNNYGNYINEITTRIFFLNVFVYGQIFILIKVLCKKKYVFILVLNIDRSSYQIIMFYLDKYN